MFLHCRSIFLHNLDRFDLWSFSWNVVIVFMPNGYSQKLMNLFDLKKNWKQSTISLLPQYFYDGLFEIFIREEKVKKITVLDFHENIDYNLSNWKIGEAYIIRKSSIFLNKPINKVKNIWVGNYVNIHKWKFKWRNSY